MRIKYPNTEAKKLCFCRTGDVVTLTGDELVRAWLVIAYKPLESETVNGLYAFGNNSIVLVELATGIMRDTSLSTLVHVYPYSMLSMGHAE